MSITKNATLFLFISYFKNFIKETIKIKLKIENELKIKSKNKTKHA